MLKKHRKLIDENRPEFGIMQRKYPSNLITIYSGDDCEIAISRDGKCGFVYPKKLTKDMIVNHLPEQMPPIDPKTQKPWFERPVNYKDLTEEDQKYIDAILQPLNENFHAVLIYPFTKLSERDVSLGKVSGKIIYKPQTSSVSGTTDADNLSSIQVEMYDKFGKFVYDVLPEPEYYTPWVQSACGIDFLETKRGFFSAITVITYEGGDCRLGILSSVFATERSGKFDILHQQKEALNNVLQENKLTVDEIKFDSFNLQGRQAAVAYIYKKAMLAIDNILKCEIFKQEWTEVANRPHPVLAFVPYKKRIPKNIQEIIPDPFVIK